MGMKLRASHAVIAFYAVLIAGCATPGTSNLSYAPPEKSAKLPNEMVVNKPFDAVWDSFVHNLAKSFYVINNIDKQSRIINVSFSTETPETYADCGISTRTYSRGDENHTYTYNVASTSTFKVASRTGASNKLPLTALVTRHSSLEGRINIYVAPEGPNTRISVNARYVLTVKAEGTYVEENLYGNPIARGTLPTETATATFNTNQPVTTDWSTPEQPNTVTCQARGRLESDILQLTQKL
jgi:hypothetical protein